jgi:outer membrane scaffolding protein for murein synthesis (MipA/OmpV family)
LKPALPSFALAFVLATSGGFNLLGADFLGARAAVAGEAAAPARPVARHKVKRAKRVAVPVETPALPVEAISAVPVGDYWDFLLHPSTPDFTVTVSAMGSASPLFPGAKRYGFFGLPGISIRKGHDLSELDPFSAPDDSFGIALYHDDTLQVGAAARWIGERSASSNHELYGLPTIAATIQVGGFMEYRPTEWMRARIEVLQGVTGNHGLVANLGADVWRSWGPITLSLGPRLYFGDVGYANGYFSVTPAQSLVNLVNGGRLTPYNAVGGLTAAGFTAVARYDINEIWRVSAFANLQYLTGSVAGSPVVTQAGSRDQYFIGLEVAYRFRTKGWLNF